MKPLLILDCDEVILEFAAPLTRWLHDVHDVELRLDTFAFHGNMRHRADGRLVDAAELPALLDGFFTHGQILQTPFEGAIDTLTGLAADMELVVLTNIPAAHRDQRVDVLRGLGLDVPVYANDGPKGPMLKQLAQGRRAVFVDDLPPHHGSAAKHAPHVGRLHMVGAPALRSLIPDAPEAHARIDDWPAAADWIRLWMEKNA